MARNKRSQSLLFKVSSLLLLIGPLLMGGDAKAQGKPEGEPSTLAEDSFGLLPLPSKDSITVKRLQIVFPNATVEQKTGQQDGPDFTYYRITKDSVHLADIRMDPDANTIKRVSVHSPEVPDTYGVEIGMSYTDIKEKRPDIDHATDYHYDTYAYVPDSHIAYEIDGKIENCSTPCVDRRNYKEEEIQHWTVKRLVWRRDVKEEK